MNQTRSISLEQIRAQLYRAEAQRRASRGRSWNVKTWEECLNTISGLERDRDYKLKQQIDQARQAANKEYIFTLFEQYNNQIGADVTWYRAREKDLRELREVWRTGQATAPAIEQLTRHYARIAYRLRERQVALRQIEIERLEEQRRQGQNLSGDWNMYWKELRAAFDAQDAAYRRIYTQPIQHGLYKERREWCLKLRRHQSATASRMSIWRRRERAELTRAIAQVDALITELQPPAPRMDLGALAAIVVVALIAVFAFLVLRNDESNGPAALHQPARTAQTLVGPALGAETPGIAATAPANLTLDAQTLNQRAVELLKQNNYQEARELFQQAAAANPNSYEPHNNMAFCLYELGQAEQAIEQWREALVLSEQNSPDANAGLGMALYAAGRQDEGFRYYQRASALNQDYRDENLLRSRYFWGDKAIADSRPLREQLTP